jgi:DNA-binding transcriptional LysR family regulator
MQLDIGLLTALDALLSEGSVTGAAARMNRCVSAMSRTLSRLRHAVGDPILVRAGARLVPTPRAEHLKSRVRDLIEEANSIFAPDRLDLNLLRRTFVIRANDAFIGAFAIDLLSRIHVEAPGARLCFTAEGEEDVSALRDGRIDLDIGVQGPIGPEVKTQALFQEHFVGIVNKRHDLCKGRVTAKRFAAFSHIIASRRGIAQGPVDHALARLGCSRQVAMIVPSHTSVLDVVSKSDLVGTVPATLAERAVREQRAIQMFKLPFETKGLAIGQAWHPRLDGDPAHRWLRSRIRDVCRMTIRADRI